MRDEDKARLIEICKRELIGIKLGARYNHPIEDKKFWVTMEQVEPDEYNKTLRTVLLEEVPKLGLQQWFVTSPHAQAIVKKGANNVR